jgi:hypothetical protein
MDNRPAARRHFWRGTIQNYLGSLLAGITFAAGAALVRYRKAATMRTGLGAFVFLLAVLLIVSGSYLTYRGIRSWVKRRAKRSLPLVILEFNEGASSFSFHKISGGPAFSVEAESEDIGDRNKLHFGPAEVLADENPVPATFSLLCWNTSSKEYFPNGFVGSDFLTACDMIRAQTNQLQFSAVVTISCKDRFGQRVRPTKLMLAHQKYGKPLVRVEFLGPSD